MDTGEDSVRDRSSTWRSTWVVVVVLLLLMFSMTWVFTRPIFEPEEEEAEPYAWEVPAEPLIISEDTTWTLQKEQLDQPIVVTDSATLTLDRCNIEVDLEDLVFWQRPAIRVQDGSALEIVDSELEIVSSKYLNTSVVGDFWLQEAYVPNLARMVNLGNATEPFLKFEYKNRYAPVPISVGVLPEGEDRVRVIHTFEPIELGGFDWVRVEVPLSEFKGTSPWVTIFPQSFPEGLMFVSDIQVEDGGGVPQGDMFPTGNPVLDGWEMRGFNDLGWMMESYVNGSHSSGGLEELWKGLIEADGEVTINRSYVTAPDDLSRRGARERVKESLELDPAYEILGTATKGGHIFVNGSRLTLLDSEIVNVPILCNDTFLDAEDCNVIGEGDLLTMNVSRGTIENIVFVMVEPAQGLPFRDSHMRPQWALGIEGTMEGYWTEVLNSTFTDCQQAIDLDRATIKLAGCEFDSTKRLTIWDHVSHLYNFLGGPHKNWDEIEDANTFSGDEGDVYLKSWTVAVYFEDNTGTLLNYEVEEVHGPFHDIPLFSPPDWRFLSWEDNHAQVITPIMLVDSEGLRYEQETVYISALVSGQNMHDWLYPEFNVTAGLVVVDVTEDHPTPHPSNPMYLGHFDKTEFDASGEFEAFLVVDPHEFSSYDLTLVVDLDGEQNNETAIPRSLYDSDETETASFHFIFTPGLHTLNATLVGVRSDDPLGASELLLSMNFTIIRLEGDMRDLPEHTLFEVDAVVVEAGTDVLLGSISPRYSEWIWRIPMTGLYNSSISFEGIDIPESSYLQIRVKGISLNLKNATLPDLFIIHNRNGFKDGWEFTMEVSDSNFGSLSYSGDSRVKLSNVTTYYHLRIDQSSDKGLEVTNCSIGGVGGWFTKLSADVIIRNCVVNTEVGCGLVVEVEGAGSLKIIGSRFLGSHLAIYRPAESFDLETEVQVTDCEFIGDYAILYVGFNLQRMTTFDVEPDFVPPMVGTIDGNVFDGEGSGVVLYHGLFERLYHDNTLSDGGMAHAYYVLVLRVMDTEGTPPRPEFWIVPTDTIIPSTLFSDDRYLTLEGEMMLDVTDDLSAENDPPEIGIVLTADYRPDSKVRGFAPIDPLVDAGELTLAVRVPFEDILLDHVTDWP